MIGLKKVAVVIFIISGIILSGVFADRASADTVDELRAKIAETQAKRAELEREIAKYSTQLAATSKEAQSLQTAVKNLEITEQKLLAELKRTESKIRTASLTIEELGMGIGETRDKIEINTEAIREAIREINLNEDVSLLETILSGDSLGVLWDKIETLRQYQNQVDAKTKELAELQLTLQEKKFSQETQKKSLIEFTEELSDQKKIISSNKAQKSNLLSQTKNQETEYKKILAQKEALRAAFEKELLQFESELRIVIDPKSVPRAGKGVLAWPLDSVFVTQYFGNTAFAKSGAYNGSGHNGVDFRAAVGTPVKTALSGVIKGSGDTDTSCRGASYGKWILVEHPNGLSTLYAHLSLIKATSGQKIETGQVIGYSGATGYSTGPHLHFSVYATQGVRVSQVPSRVCGTTYTMPVADLRAYLNPIEYL